MNLNNFEYLWNQISVETRVLNKELNPLEYRTIDSDTTELGLKAYTLASIALIIPDTRLFKLFYTMNIYSSRLSWRTRQ